MPRLQIAGFSPRVKFIIVTSLTLLPLASVLMLVILSVYLPVFDSMRLVVRDTTERMVPAHRLQVALQHAVMPPNDFLIHGDPDERRLFHALADQVDVQFEAILHAYREWPTDRERLMALRQEWLAAREVGELLFDSPVRAASPEVAQAMEAFDARVDQTSAALDAFTETLQAGVINSARRSEQLERLGISAMGLAFLLALGLGVGASVFLSRERRSLEETVLLDPLTGVFNRRGFEEKLKEAARNALIYRRAQFAVVLLDVDFFKGTNDTHGHQVGDAVLCYIADTARGHLRGTDVFARLGGDEFVMVLFDINRDQVRTLTERVRRAIADGSAARNGAVDVRTSVTMGFACFPEDARTESDLVDHADKALYLAKQAGRNCIRGYDEVRSQDDVSAESISDAAEAVM